MSLPCIVCDKQLEDAMPDVDNQPYDATAFTASGHYGLTVFDPMVGNTMLEINVCTECLTLKHKSVFHVTVERKRPVLTYITWAGSSQ